MSLIDLTLQKEIQKSFELEKELKKKLDKDIKSEEEILTASLSIAENLLHNSKVRAVIDGKQFLVTMKVQSIKVKKIHLVSKKTIDVPEDFIVLLFADINKYNLTGGKYLPFTAKAKIDKQYSMKDNIKTIVEAFIRNITGNIKPEMIE